MKKIKGKIGVEKQFFTFFLIINVLACSFWGEGQKLYAKAMNGYDSIMKSEAEEIEITEIKESTLYAGSAVLMDAQTGRILYGKNEEAVLPMASTTKIMTLLVALEEADLSKVVTVSSYAAKMPDVQLNIREGEQYYLKDLLYSLMLESHNDSAVAIAEAVAGSIEKFAEKMNRKAKEIGCENTTFITPNGLDATATLTRSDGTKEEVFHSTTAKDLARIMSYCVTDFPKKEQFLEITRTQEYTFSDCSKNRSFTCRNHNAFLHMMKGALSGKTGFTGKAGYCYVGALERDGKTLVVSLLACGWPNNKTYKWKDTTKLMEYGLENFEYVSFADTAKEIPKSGQIKVLNGQTGEIGETAYVKWKVQESDGNSNGKDTIAKNVEDEKAEEEKLEGKKRAEEQDGILLRKDEKMDLEWEVSETLEAPVKAGEQVGYIRYKVNDKVYKEEKLILQSAIERIDYNWCLDETWKRFLLFS